MKKTLRFLLVLLVLSVGVSACGVGSSSLPSSSGSSSDCENVVYAISVPQGKVNKVSITLNNATGDTEQYDKSLPFRATFKMCEGWNFKYISAQITEPTSNAGAIKCVIEVDGVEVSSANASGFPNIATCSD